MYSYRVEVVRVLDGDSIEVDIDLGFHITYRAMLRLAGVNAPETRTLDLDEKIRGFAVKAELEILLKNAKRITVTTEKTGKYGRWLGYVYAEYPQGMVSVNDKVREWSKV